MKYACATVAEVVLKVKRHYLAVLASPAYGRDKRLTKEVDSLGLLLKELEDAVIVLQIKLAEERPLTNEPAEPKPKPTKKARVGPQRAHVAPSKANQKKATAAAARDGSKTAKVLDLLKRPDGATLKELKRLAYKAVRAR
jgi:hypothetical protein